MKRSFNFAGVDEISLAGPAGAGGFVDTSTCLHAGSRCQDGERVVLVIRYMPAYRAATTYNSWFTSAHTNGDPIRRMVVPTAQ